MALVKVKNRATGVESELTAEQWEKVKNDPMWLDVFTVMSPAVKPTEVAQLEGKQAAPIAGK